MSIQIKGIDAILRKLGKVQGVAVLEKPMQRAVHRIERDMKEYPPGPWRRTGTLGRRWTTRISKSADGITGQIGNTTLYGPFVQSERFQTRWHRRTGWRTDVQAIDKNRAAIEADFQREIDRALEG